MRGEQTYQKGAIIVTVLSEQMQQGHEERRPRCRMLATANTRQCCEHAMRKLVQLRAQCWLDSSIAACRRDRGRRAGRRAVDKTRIKVAVQDRQSLEIAEQVSRRERRRRVRHGGRRGRRPRVRWRRQWRQAQGNADAVHLGPQPVHDGRLGSRGMLAALVACTGVITVVVVLGGCGGVGACFHGCAQSARVGMEALLHVARGQGGLLARDALLDNEQADPPAQCTPQIGADMQRRACRHGLGNVIDRRLAQFVPVGDNVVGLVGQREEQAVHHQLDVARNTVFGSDRHARAKQRINNNKKPRQSERACRERMRGSRATMYLVFVRSAPTAGGDAADNFVREDKHVAGLEHLRRKLRTRAQQGRQEQRQEREPEPGQVRRHLAVGVVDAPDRFA